MEPEGSSPYSQEPAIYPYPEPDRSSLRPPSNLSKIRFNIIFPSTPGSSKWFIPLGFSTKTLYAPLLSPFTCYMSCPSQSSWLDHPNDIWDMRFCSEPFLNIFNIINFLRWGVFSTSPNTQAGGPRLFGCLRLLIQYIRSYPPYLEAVPPSATQGRSMPW